MKLTIFCRCSLFPSWSGLGLISTPCRGLTHERTWLQSSCDGWYTGERCWRRSV